MKKAVFVTLLSLAYAGTSVAQTNTTDKKPGQPNQPMQGSTMNPPAGQPMPSTAGGQPNQPMPPTAAQPARPNQPMPPPTAAQPAKPNQPMPATAGGPTWAPEKCEKAVPKAKKMAENCLKIKAEDKRSACFDQIGGKMPAGFMDACRQQIEPVKAEMDAKMKEMYPNQKTAQKGPEGRPEAGKDQKGPGMPQQAANKNMKPVDCGKIVEKLHQEGDKCLKVKEQAKRKMCFDKVGEEVSKSGAEQSCGDALNALKSEYQNKEAQAYAGQPASIN